MASDADIVELNRSFYAAEPHEYFRRRLELLVLQACASTSLERIARRGLRFGRVEIRGEARGRRSRRDVELEDERRSRFVIAESLALQHHAAETLLRLYISHQGNPPCPWLVLAAERSPQAFKQAVESLRDVGVDDLDAMASVFYGLTSPPEGWPASDEFKASIENVGSWLRHYSGVFLEGAHLYNAAKHGLAVQPGTAVLRIAETDAGAPFMSATGPSLSFLELDEKKHWKWTTQWPSLELSVFSTLFACRLIENLWAVARLCYLDEKPPSNSVAFLLEPGFSATADALRTRSPVTTFSLTLNRRARR